jgi:Na+-transporting methylmalonyl-CoA/oxaloacetate decarboxylase gamma subunit
MSELAGYGVNLTIVGLAIVFGVLGAIAVIVSLIGRLDERWQARERELDQSRLDRPPTIDATTAVLIAAAVATYLQGRHRIRSVRRLLPADASTSPWSSSGRAVLQGSHVIGRRSR